MKMCIFDLDGTLINSIEDLAYSVNQALMRLEMQTHPVEAYYRFVGDGVDKLIERALGQRLDLFDKAKQYFNEIYKTHCLVDTKVYPGIHELLKTLKNEGCLLSVVSNKPDPFVKQVIEALFPNTFDFISGKVEGIAPKPYPELVLRVIKMYQLDKQNVYYIGDSDVDIYTAKNAGVNSIGVTWGFRGEEELKKAEAMFVAKEANDIYKIIYQKK